MGIGANTAIFSARVRRARVRQYGEPAPGARGQEAEWRRACCANAAMFSVKVTATNRCPGDDDFLKV
jgi:hypothetical protein